MVVSINDIPDGSLVKHFITSGKRGYCELCRKLVEKLEAHHVCYSPEKTLKLCHDCHHKVHFWPARLNEKEKFKLLSKRFSEIQAVKLLSEKTLTPVSFAKLVAPSRQAFIHASQKLDIQRIRKPVESSHSEKVIKVNKEVSRLKIVNREKPN